MLPQHHEVAGNREDLQIDPMHALVTRKIPEINEFEKAPFYLAFLPEQTGIF